MDYCDIVVYWGYGQMDCKTPTLLNVFFLILSGWRGCKGNFKKISVPMTLNWYLEDNGRFK